MFRLSCSFGILALLVVLASPCTAQTTFNNSTPITINTSGVGQLPMYAVPSNIAVSGLSGTVADVTVTLHSINHNWDLGSTTVLLTGPGGQRLVLVSKAGVAESGWPLTNSTLVLSDGAGSLIPATWAPLPNNTTVMYRPTAYVEQVQWMPGAVDVCGGNCPVPADQGSNTLLSTFGGIDPNGTWSLAVRVGWADEVLNIAGGWSITLTIAASAAPTTTTLSSSQTPSYTTNPVTFTASVASGGSPVSGQGAITFKDGSTVLSGPTPIDASGQATFTTSALDERTHTITAEYSGTGVYGVSSGTVMQIVKRHPTIDGNRFCNPTSITIPESGKTGSQPTGDAATPYPSYMDVNLSGLISKLTVSLNSLTHGSISDVDMMLVSPAGQKFVLWSDIGLQSPVNSLDIVLDDAAASLLPDVSNPASGTYRPTSYAGTYTDQFPIPAPGGFSWPAPEGPATLATFNGSSPTGEWALYVMDQRAGNTGLLAGGWCLDFTLATPDLRIDKAHSGNFRQGGTGAYSLTVTNSGSGPTSGTVTVTDTPPAGLTVTNMSGTGWTCDTPTRTCTRNDSLAAAASYSAITVAVDVASDAPSSVTNTASVSGGGDDTAGNNSDSDVTTIELVADLTVTKTHSGNFTQGQTGATYAVTVRNSGAGPTTGTVTLHETAQPGFTVTGMSGTGWTCNTDTCTRSDAWPATTDYPAITVTVNVANDASASVTNSVTVSGGGELDTSNNVANDPTTITQLADLTIAKSHSGNFRQGQTGAQYTLTVTNVGSAATSGIVTVTDTLPAGLTATALGGTSWACDVATRTCTRSDALAAGQAYPPITVTVDVAANAAASITNTAAVSGGGEVITTNNAASDIAAVAQVADLAVAKTHSGNFRQGQTGATYTITVSNTGNGPTLGTITVIDTLPADLTVTGMAGVGWTCAALTCTRDDVLASGGSYPAITLTVNVASDAAASVTNVVAVSGGGELNTGNNSAFDATTVVQAADLVVAKSHAGDFTQGQTSATYTIAVSNAGAGPTVGLVSVTDTLPAGLSVTGWSGTGWNCVGLSCTRSDVLASGGSYPPLTLTVNVAANAPAVITNNVTVSGGGELNAGNNSASDPTTVIQLADLTVTKAHTGHFTRGKAGAYTIVVRNAGFAATSGTVTVTDTLPAGLTAAAISGAGWSCTLAAVSCSRSDALAAGDSYPAITLTVNAAADAPTSVANTVTVAGGVDVNPSDNTATDVTTVLMIPDITWPTPAAIVYGTPLNATQLNASSSVAGTFSYSPAAGTVLDAGPRTLTTTFTPSDTNVWAPTTAQVTLTVNKATPVITWAAPAAIAYGTALGGTELAATADVSGSFAYAPGPGTMLSAGTHTLSVVFTPSDTANYNNASATASVTVNKAAPVITWATPAAIVYGTPLGAAQLSATANVPGTFAYAPSAGAVLPAGSQTLNATFTPGDSANYNTVTASVTQLVNKATPTITWLTPAPISPGTALSASQLNATASVAGTFMYSPAAGTTLPAGIHALNVTFTPADSANYNSAAVSVTLAVREKAQSIYFPPIPDRWYRDSPVLLAATASSGLPVSYTVVSGPATVNGSMLTITGPGRISVRASQEGGSAWEPAADVEQSFVAGYRTEVRALPGLTVRIDDMGVAGGSALIWEPGTTHRISVLPFQATMPGRGYRFASWSDGGAREHTITAAAADAVYTASFVLQFQLTVNIQPTPEAGAVVPGTAFFDAGTTVALEARPNAGYNFVGYSGDVDGPNFAMTEPRSVTATFAAGPKLDAVTDSASFRQAPLTSGGLFTAWGSGLGEGTLAITDSAGVERMATVVYASAKQVNFITPAGLAHGPALLRYIGAGGLVSTLAVEVAAVAPGLFSANMGGSGAPAGQMLRLNGAGEVVFSGALAQCDAAGKCESEPVGFGEPADQIFVILYGTGLRNYASIHATIGGVEAEITWAGAQPTYPGLDQINLRLPRALAGRGLVELTVTVDGRVTNALELDAH